jgi:hypothetical protein
MTKTTKTTVDIDLLTAAEILAVPQDQPEYLFTGDADVLKAEYRSLVKRWHPDVNTDPRARDVFEHLTKLHNCAETRLKDGVWQIPGTLSLTETDGKKYQLVYKKKAPFDFGDLYISRTLATYVFRKDCKAQYDKTVANIRAIAFANDRIRKEFARNLPQIEKTFAADLGYVLILKKDEEFVRLRDLLDHAGGKLDPKHAAWIMSGLHNMSCYLTAAKLTHNDIGPDTYFVGPKSHRGMLLGGWTYAVPAGKKIELLPDRTYDAAPADIMRDGKADPRMDLGLIRLTGREMLGDPKGIEIHRKKEIPKPLSTWLRMPSSGDAFKDYEAWETSTLRESFGARRYVELKTTFSDIYESKGEKPWVSHPPSTSSATAAPRPR